MSKWKMYNNSHIPIIVVCLPSHLPFIYASSKTQSLQFDVSKIRNHLFKCLEAKSLEPFTLSGIYKNEHLGSLDLFRVYCRCLVAIDNEDITQTCNMYSEKFRRYCQYAVKEQWHNYLWYCSECWGLSQQ